LIFKKTKSIKENAASFKNRRSLMNGNWSFF
jgi:hypothetical protein